MTEKEFMQQLWRPYDMVSVEGGIKGRVVNVCFSTRSVRVSMKNGTPEWFKCDLIIEHTSQSGTTDLKIIDELREKVLRADRKIHDLELEREKLQEKLQRSVNDDILRCLNMIKEGLTEKKKKIEKVENGLAEIERLLPNIKE